MNQVVPIDDSEGATPLEQALESAAVTLFGKLQETAYHNFSMFAMDALTLPGPLQGPLFSLLQLQVRNSISIPS